MLWIYHSLAAPILFALTNYVDKILVDRFSKDGKGIGTLILYSSLYAILVILVIFMFLGVDVLSVTKTNSTILIVSGMIQFFAIIFYLKAFAYENVTKIYSVFLTIPVFGLFFDIVFFKEHFNFWQLFGAFLTLISVFFLNHDFSKSLHIKNNAFITSARLFIYALISSLMYALSRVVFKFGTADDTEFFLSVFWEQIGLFAMGILVFIFIKSFRSEFVHSLKKDGLNLFLINMTGETLTMIGNLCLNMAVVLAPIFLVYSIESSQQLFVILLGILFTIFLPKLYKEEISLKMILHNLLWSTLIVIGLMILIYWSV